MLFLLQYCVHLALFFRTNTMYCLCCAWAICIWAFNLFNICFFYVMILIYPCVKWLWQQQNTYDYIWHSAWKQIYTVKTFYVSLLCWTIFSIQCPRQVGKNAYLANITTKQLNQKMVQTCRMQIVTVFNNPVHHLLLCMFNWYCKEIITGL